MEFEGVAELRIQAAHITGVEPSCSCGCPSITPTIDRSTAGPAVGSHVLPVELLELERHGGIERTVICFLDDEGYLSNVECVYYDEATDEWPDVDQCAVLLRDSDHYIASVLLPSGVQVSPHEPGDRWVSIDVDAPGLTAITWSGWRETYSTTGDLVARTLTK